MNLPCVQLLLSVISEEFQNFNAVILYDYTLISLLGWVVVFASWVIHVMAIGN